MLYLGMDMAPDVIYVPPVEGTITLHIPEWDITIPVEPWAKYAAIDESGLVHIYETRPTCETAGMFEDFEWMHNTGRCRYAGEVELTDDEYWQELIVELKHGN